ncbi:MAG TPA: HEAT repeat domain-containing protein [Vicinamibacteria bacterium]|nr:HEAT repeat domain-containing protein [Vicinamibacteria bacterium]
MIQRTGSATLVLVLLAGLSAAASRPSFEDLVANLKSPNASTRREAAADLGRSRRREAVTPLASMVRDPDTKVRLEVVRALRELRDPSAVPAIVTSLADGEPQIREEAIGSLVELFSERDRGNPVGRFLELFSDEYDRSSIAPSGAVDPGVIQALAGKLRDDEKDIRQEAALALGILNGTEALPALTTALRDPEPSVRGAAATAIGKIGSADNGRALVPLLSDDSATVRNRVLQAVGVLHVREAGPALRQLYEANRRKEGGARILAALSRIGDPAQADLFQELVQDPDPERKRLAIEGLGRISDASRLPAFKKDYQREKNDELRLAYSFALTLLGDRAFLDTIVLSLPSRTLGTRSRSYLLEMGPSILPELYPYLNDPEAEIRATLCDIIASFGDPESIPRLTPLINDPSQTVADKANRAVERLRRVGGAKAAR